MSYAFHLPAILILAAVVMDIVLGDPHWLPHPVSLIGYVVAYGERRFHTGNPGRDLVSGALVAIAVVTLTIVTSWTLIAGMQAINCILGAIAATLLAWTTLAARGLNDAAAAVERSLDANDEEASRREIRALVGRDPDALDRCGLLRAAIESVAENSSDGVIAPLIFLLAAGPVGALAYKAINTLDSMVGYKAQRHLYFGKFAARLDDVANLLPARLTAVSIALAAAPVTGRTLTSLGACWRDGHKHDSPNAGYPQAAMAGALGVELGGDAYYDGELERRPRFGHAQAAIDVGTLRTSRTLMWIAVAIVLVGGIVARGIAARLMGALR